MRRLTIEQQAEIAKALLAGERPHANPDVLHGPGVCEACDKFSWLQYLRMVQGRPFTVSLEWCSVRDSVIYSASGPRPRSRWAGVEVDHVREQLGLEPLGGEEGRRVIGT